MVRSFSGSVRRIIPRLPRPLRAPTLVKLSLGLQTIGINRLWRRLGLFSILSFGAGLSLAGFLLIVGECAIDVSERHHFIDVHGHAVGISEALWFCGFLLVSYTVLSLLVARLSSALATATLSASRRRLVSGFFGASWDAQSAERLGHLQQLIGVNCNVIAGVVLGIARGLQALIMLVSLLGIALAVSPLASLAVIAVGLLLSLLVRPFGALNQVNSGRLAQASRGLGTLVTEYSRLAREFRLFGVEQRALCDIEASIDSTGDVFFKTNLVSLTSPIVYQLGALLFVLAAVGVVAGHVEGSLSSFGAVLLLVLRSLTSASGLQGFNQQIHASMGYVDDFLSNLKRYDADRPETQTRHVDPIDFALRLDEVSFSYDGKVSALRDISLYVPAGASLGVVGRTGSGKTTLGQLLLGLREPDSGSATIGGVPASHVTRAGQSTVVAFVSQEPILLQGSIASNISFFRDLSLEQIERAARAAQLHEDIVAMPDGYDTPVGDGGAALSGGQRQRVAIARALAADPRILVLDEPTSALDPRSEALVRRAIGKLRGNVTIVAITHRLNSLDDCDLLAVLQDGALVDFGSRAHVAEGPAFRAAFSHRSAADISTSTR